MNAWRNGHAKFDPRAHSSYSTRRGAFSIVARICQLRGIFKSATFVVERTPSTLSCFDCHDLHIASKHVFKNTHKKRKDVADFKSARTVMIRATANRLNTESLLIPALAANVFAWRDSPPKIQQTCISCSGLMKGQAHVACERPKCEKL